MTEVVLLAGLIGLLIGILVTAASCRLTRALRDLDRRLGDLEQEQRNLEAVKSRARQTGATMAGLEDAMAAIIRVQANREAEQVYLDASLRAMQAVRKGPYAYDPETSSGDRKDFK